MQYGYPQNNALADEPRHQSTAEVDDSLGRMLSGKWQMWKTARRPQEDIWLKNLRAHSKINESYVSEKGGMHDYVYIGSTLEKCNAAFSRISDPLFKTENHWDIEHTPIPETSFSEEDYKAYMDEVQLRTDGMRKEIEDKLIDLNYENHLKDAIHECVILGSGCIKGALPSIKSTESWQLVNGSYQLIKSDIPAPTMDSPSVFNLYVDPYAVKNADISGVFERHVVNRIQLATLKNDTRFDADKIDDILRQSSTGKHDELYHELERRKIAAIYSNYNSQSEIFDLLEYWGQVSGRDLQTAGFVNVDEIATYWVNIWVCQDKAIFSRLMPMDKKVIPYHIFHYTKVPHKFWGMGIAALNEEAQYAINDTVRDMLDGLSFAAKPMAEVNVAMLKEGQDPAVILPAMIYLRDSGDPNTPAVRFFQPNVPTNALAQAVEMFKEFSDENSMIPRLSYGYSSGEMNQTKGGTLALLGVASLPTKLVIKNIEDLGIKPFITSLFNWIMQWSDNESIKGDMSVSVRCSSVLIAKEERAERLMQFSTAMASNPETAKITDFDYLAKETAKALDIDPDKAVPEKPEEQPQPPLVDPLVQAKVALMQAQTETEAANKAKVVAETAATNIKTMFGAVQTDAQIEANPALIAGSDELLKSAGFADANQYPIAPMPEQAIPVQDDGLPSNTSPQFPANIPQPSESALEPSMGIDMTAAKNNSMSPHRGMETVANEAIQ